MQCILQGSGLGRVGGTGRAASVSIKEVGGGDQSEAHFEILERGSSLQNSHHVAGKTVASNGLLDSRL